MERERHQVNPAANELESRTFAFAAGTRLNCVEGTAIEVKFARGRRRTDLHAGPLRAAKKAEANGRFGFGGRERGGVVGRNFDRNCERSSELQTRGEHPIWDSGRLRQ